MTVEADFRLGAKPAAAVTEEVIPGLVWGVRCSGAEAAPIGEAVAGAAPGEWLWLHFNLADRRAPAWLAASALVPKPAMERLLSTDDTQQIVPCGASVAGVFFDLLYDFDRTIDEFGHFRFVLTEQLLLTGRRHALTSVEAVRQRVETGHRFASPVDLLAAIVAQIAATIERVVGEQADAIDQIEDTVLKALAPDDRARLGATRLTSVRIHRRLNGLRGVFRRLLANPSEGLMSALCHAAGPLAQRLDEIDQEVIELRDRARLLQDEITIKLAEQTNRHLHVLSIVTTLLLPPSLVASLFGMNVGGLPFAGSGAGFWLAFAVALAASAIAAWVLSAIGVFKGRHDR